jgi:hypothetical protein
VNRGNCSTIQCHGHVYARFFNSKFEPEIRINIKANELDEMGKNGSQQNVVCPLLYGTFHLGTDFFCAMFEFRRKNCEMYLKAIISFTMSNNSDR